MESQLRLALAVRVHLLAIRIHIGRFILIISEGVGNRCIYSDGSFYHTETPFPRATIHVSTEMSCFRLTIPLPPKLKPFMTPTRDKRSESSFAVPNVLDEFYMFEKHADASVAELSIWELPIRSVLSSLYLSADAKFVGGRFNRKMPRDADVGTAMISRLSYVSSYFGKVTTSTTHSAS